MHKSRWMSYDNDITYSRHLSGQDRIIYDIYDEVVTVLVIELEGHYNDK